MLVSLFVHDLHSNPIVRAASIAAALQALGFTIEVLGFVPKHEHVYRPYADYFAYKTVCLDSNESRRLPAERKLARMASGDIFYAFKPLRTTLLPAMMASRLGFQKPVLLDVEDDDLHVCEAGLLRRAARGVRRGFPRASFLTVSVVHQLRRRCVHTTVASTGLQSFYGGTILLHGPDEDRFSPERADLDKSACRKRLGLPVEGQLVLFAGKPAFHKGLHTIVSAIAELNNSSCCLVLAGDSSRIEFQEAKRALGQRCFLTGFIRNDLMPELLHAVDVVPVPQLNLPFARTQIPAKLIEAMAMGKSIIVSSVGDLPAIVGDKTHHPRGWAISPDTPRSLAECLRLIESRPQEAQRRGHNAREFFLENASVRANSRLLENALENRAGIRPPPDRASSRARPL